MMSLKRLLDISKKTIVQVPIGYIHTSYHPKIRFTETVAFYISTYVYRKEYFVFANSFGHKCRGKSEIEFQKSAPQ